MGMAESLFYWYLNMAIFSPKIYQTRMASIYRKIRHRAMVAWERMQGLDFSTTIPPRELGFDDSQVFRGSPSGNIYLFNILRDMNISASDRFLDIGCSKGSAIRCALNYPFEWVDGIEIAPPLASIASKNFRKLDKNNVKIYNMDAREFQKYGDYNFFYLYNPCPESVLAPILNRIADSALDRELVIIYNNPTCHTLIQSHGFNKFLEYPDEWGNGIFVYSNKSKLSRLTR